jgi:hypothetical protein
LARQFVPNLALAVALVKQQDSWTGLGCREEGCLEPRSISGGEVNDARRLLRKCNGRKHERKERENV